MLITIPEAAERLGGVPVKPLATAARAHGLLIRIGSSSFVREDELTELIEKCRCQPKVPDCSKESARAENPCGSSKTPGDTKKAHARGIAAKLKSNSPRTSNAKTDNVVRLDQEK